MEAIFYIMGVAIGLIVLAAVAHGVAYLLTEFFDWRIPVKPFNCRPCLTFWLTWGAVAAAAPKLAEGMVGTGIVREEGAMLFALVLVGALLGLTNFFFVKSKTNIYD